jgi:hypothetical protein
MLRSRSAAIVLLLVALAGLAFVVRSHPVYRPSTPQEKAIVSVVTSDLTGLRNAEFVYFQLNGRFTSNADSTIFLQTPGVSAPSITLEDLGWYATMTDRRLPGVTCAIAVRTKNPLQRSAAEGEAVCR